MLQTNLYRILTLLAVATSFAGCVYEGAGDIVCEDGKVSGDRLCVDGYWVIAGSDMVVIDDAENDATNNVVEDMPIEADMGPDAEVDMFVCMPENDTEFCDRLGKDCGTVTDLDNCNEMRQVQCGNCIAPFECGTDNVCSCESESDTEFCTRLGKDCGMVTDADNCGRSKTVDCGMCAGNEVCGERSPNVCGCPCDIAGTCYPDGAPNPGNPCEICDPSVSTTDWTVNAGASCSDGDACTINDVCTAAAACEGQARDCSSEDTDCADGVCDAANGNCVAQFKTNGTACTTDNVSCTVDQCINGACDHDEIVTGECRIGGTCYNAGAGNPSNECEACRPGMSQSAFSNRTNGASCTGDSLNCTVDQCIGGTCDSSTVAAGSCLVGGTCYTDGAENPSNDCEECDSATSATTFSNKMNGASCAGDSLSCTVDQCMGGTCDSSTVAAGSCLVGGTCYTQGTTSPMNECEECTPSTSQTSFTARSNGTSCSGDGLSCTVDQCVNGTCDHSTLQANTCRIAGTCYADNDPNPANECEACDPATPTAWSDNNGATCDDGLSCTGNGTCSGGSCSAGSVTSGCLISGMCVADGTFENVDSCNVCDPGTSATSYTTLGMGAACEDDGFACTTDVCNGSGTCVHAVTVGCLIDGACRTDGELNPNNPCQVCDPANSTTSWSNVPAGQKGGCGGGGNCVCNSSQMCAGASC